MTFVVEPPHPCGRAASPHPVAATAETDAATGENEATQSALGDLGIRLPCGLLP